jgi:hypothetical protein
VEWGALSRKEDTDKTDRLFFDVVASVTDARPQDDTQQALFQSLLELANTAGAHRDERLALSVKRMPRTLHIFVSLTGFTIMLLVLCYPFHNVVLGAASVVIIGMLLLFARFVVADLDNPFEGSWNVSSDPFAELMTKFR